MHCPVCQRHELIVITMTVSGRDVSFSSCAQCDARWWSDGEGRFDLPSLRDRMAPAGR